MTDEFKVALIRGLIEAVLVGALAFLGTWSQTDDVQTLVIASLTPALSTLAIRFGFEGAVDSARGKGDKG